MYIQFTCVRTLGVLEDESMTYRNEHDLCWSKVGCFVLSDVGSCVGVWIGGGNRAHVFVCVWTVGYVHLCSCRRQQKTCIRVRVSRQK